MLGTPQKSLPPGTFGDYKCCGSGHIMILYFHVILQDHARMGRVILWVRAAQGKSHWVKKWRFLFWISSVNVTNPQETADLVTFTEKILQGKSHLLCSVSILPSLVTIGTVVVENHIMILLCHMT